MTDSQRPWFKEPYVWMLIGIPLTSVIVGIFFITAAVKNKDTLVRDNYYKDGLAYNSEVKWDKKAVEMDIQLELLVSGNDLSLTIANSRLNLPTTLKVTLGHPTIPAKDRESVLQLKEGKTFLGFIETMEDGRYYFLVESIEQQWRVRKDVWIKNGQATAI